MLDPDGGRPKLRLMAKVEIYTTLFCPYCERAKALLAIRCPSHKLLADRASDAASPRDWLAERGILAAPGDFYGAAGAEHVRIALTASDERIAAGAIQSAISGATSTNDKKGG